MVWVDKEKTMMLRERKYVEESVVGPDDLLSLIDEWTDELRKMDDRSLEMMSAARRLDLGMGSVKKIRGLLRNISKETSFLLKRVSIASRKK
jgi:hypothetical protein